MKNVQIKTIKELKSMFANQCQPCINQNPNCLRTDIVKAKKWKCQNFFNGFIYIS
jgi:hypothetical protein